MDRKFDLAKNGGGLLASEYMFAAVLNWKKVCSVTLTTTSLQIKTLILMQWPHHKSRGFIAFEYLNFRIDPVRFQPRAIKYQSLNTAMCWGFFCMKTYLNDL